MHFVRTVTRQPHHITTSGPRTPYVRIHDFPVNCQGKLTFMGDETPFTTLGALLEGI